MAKKSKTKIILIATGSALGLGTLIYFLTKKKTPKLDWTQIVPAKRWYNAGGNGTEVNYAITAVTPDGTVYNADPAWRGKVINENLIAWENISIGQKDTWVAR